MFDWKWTTKSAMFARILEILEIEGSNIPRMVPARDIYTLSYTEDNLSVDIDLTEVNAQSDIGGVGDSATAGFELLDLSVGRSFALEGVEDFRVILFANKHLEIIP